MNGRTDTLGQRHITIKPASLGADEWKVTNVLTRDVWIVKPTDTPDAYSTANGFTDYFEPGGGALYRFEPMKNGTIPDSGLLIGNLYVTPSAELYLTQRNDLSFNGDKGIVCEGFLSASGSVFSTPAESWSGILARGDGGYVSLDHCLVRHAPVIAGADGTVICSDSEFEENYYAFYNAGGIIYSTRSEASSCWYGFCTSLGGDTHLTYDYSSPSSLNGSPQSCAVSAYAGNYTDIRAEHLTGFVSGVLSVGDGTCISTDRSRQILDGKNHIEAQLQGFVTGESGLIDEGSTPGGYGTDNCISIGDTINGWHAFAQDGQVYAVDSYWAPLLDSLQPNRLKTEGDVQYQPFRYTCGAPFRSGTGMESFAGGPSGPADLVTALRDSNYNAARALLRAALAPSDARHLSLRELNIIVHRALYRNELEEMRDSVVLAFLSWPEIGPKLFAADALAAAGRYTEALSVLDSYSFAGSEALMRAALLRKSLYRPLVPAWGYRMGLAAIDSLCLIAATDSSVRHLRALYPRIFGGLHLLERTVSRSKSGSRTNIVERALPADMCISQNYPNPFSTLTSFTFKLPDMRHVRLQVFDALGRAVAEVANGVYDRGVHSEVFEAGTLPSGMYFYRFTAGDEVVQRRMLLVR